MNTQDVKGLGVKLFPLIEMNTNFNSYSIDDMKSSTFKFKVRLDGGRWVEVETSTNHLSNGLVSRIKQLLKNGEFTECSPPDTGDLARVVEVN